MASTHATEERVTSAVTSGNDRRGVASGVLCGCDFGYDNHERRLGAGVQALLETVDNSLLTG
jgi:hypothetical protein